MGETLQVTAGLLVVSGAFYLAIAAGKDVRPGERYATASPPQQCIKVKAVGTDYRGREVRLECTTASGPAVFYRKLGGSWVERKK